MDREYHLPDEGFSWIMRTLFRSSSCSRCICNCCCCICNCCCCIFTCSFCTVTISSNPEPAGGARDTHTEVLSCCICNCCCCIFTCSFCTVTISSNPEPAGGARDTHTEVLSGLVKSASSRGASSARINDSDSVRNYNRAQ